MTKLGIVVCIPPSRHPGLRPHEVSSTDESKPARHENTHLELVQNYFSVPSKSKECPITGDHS